MKRNNIIANTFINVYFSDIVYSINSNVYFTHRNSFNGCLILMRVHTCLIKCNKTCESEHGIFVFNWLLEYVRNIKGNNGNTRWPLSLQHCVSRPLFLCNLFGIKWIVLLTIYQSSHIFDRKLSSCISIPAILTASQVFSIPVMRKGVRRRHNTVQNIRLWHIAI